MMDRAYPIWLVISPCQITWYYVPDNLDMDLNEDMSGK